MDKNNVPFPPFNRGTEGVLNPLMVHFAAALRFRRLDPDRVGGLDEGAKRALKATEELQSAILWIPEKVGRSASVVEKSRVSVAQNHSALPTSASTTKTVERGTHPSLFELLHADNDEVFFRFLTLSKVKLHDVPTRVHLRSLRNSSLGRQASQKETPSMLC